MVPSLRNLSSNHRTDISGPLSACANVHGHLVFFVFTSSTGPQWAPLVVESHQQLRSEANLGLNIGKSWDIYLQMIIFHGKSHDKTSDFEVAYFKYFQANRLGGNLVEHKCFFISIESWREKEATCHFLHFDVCFSDGSHEFCRQTRILWHRIKLDVELIPVCEFLTSSAIWWQQHPFGKKKGAGFVHHLSSFTYCWMGGIF